MVDPRRDRVNMDCPLCSRGRAWQRVDEGAGVGNDPGAMKSRVNQQGPSRTEGLEAGETFGQRMVAGVLRRALRASLMRCFRAGRPVAQQRLWLSTLSNASWLPRGARRVRARVGGVPGEWVEAKSSDVTRRVVLYLHGGAYCVASPATYRSVTGGLALRCAARVFAADYRLAPEHPFPAAVDDAVAAYAGLLSAGYEPGRIFLVGDSAGGGLCLAAALRLREAGLPQPGAMALFSPWTDLSLQQLGPEPPGEVIITRAWLSECARFYLAGGDVREPLASPIFADLRDLPRVLIQAGTDEVLLPDSERMHTSLLASGAQSTLHVFPRRWHIFQLQAGLLHDAGRALDEVAAFIRA